MIESTNMKYSTLKNFIIAVYLYKKGYYTSKMQFISLFSNLLLYYLFTSKSQVYWNLNCNFVVWTIAIDSSEGMNLRLRTSLNYINQFCIIGNFSIQCFNLYGKKRQNPKVLPIQYNNLNIDIVKTRILKLKEVEWVY